MGLRDLADRSRLMVIAYYLQKDLRARLAQRNGVAPVDVKTGGSDLDASALDAYAQQTFRSILKHSGLSTDELRGRRVLELGPGNSLGAALLMLEHGACEVVALDRFAVGRTGATPDGLTFTEGVGVEDAADHFGDGRFDLIYSIAVLEHVGALEAAFASMYRLLAPGGVMGHQIGGGDHGMFTRGGHHPLTYMTLPAPLYHLMTARCGGPNRVLPVTVRRLVEPYDWDWRLTIGSVFGVARALEPYRDSIDPREFPEQAMLVETIRSRLREPFRSLPASELLVEGTFLRVRKRG